MKVIQKITPCLWFDDQAEEVVEFYTAVFRIQKSSTLLDTEKLDMKSTENRQER